MHLEGPQLSAVWQTIDRERSAVADLIDDFSSDELAMASLCAGWTVRDVAAHLTLAHTPPMTAVRDLVRARGSFDRMVHDTAVRHRAPAPDLAASLRRMVGSRRTAPMVTPVEPLLDILVHAQDMVVPLGREHPMPTRAAEIALRRVWSMGWPFHARRRLGAVTLRSTDAPWTRGSGPVVSRSTAALLLLATGRCSAALPRLDGPGVPVLAERLSA
ncbi:maleylpyruvate isomerase family mycothiol-dependent enzyme [Luteipulveratus flavus]|uniref:Maleylpyruvate isomerase family mycothiol-dependent enzyme n=1 Tax=Luteipulveratus flavus TaxID=3031728 RepID=A0ABT6C4H8_9MICO|nr:maleylpyruvate isomerase family mycothiol-dependent enzyme [Luteipulveratus sp. YIM 133296]MDF8263685.1 maleylpyruvate isomerase family mycothiol-dependent enzyme [Luteipulveratus sp. YIM 133296]